MAESCVHLSMQVFAFPTSSGGMCLMLVVLVAACKVCKCAALAPKPCQIKPCGAPDGVRGEMLRIGAEGGGRDPRLYCCPGFTSGLRAAGLAARLPATAVSYEAASRGWPNRVSATKPTWSLRGHAHVQGVTSGSCGALKACRCHRHTSVIHL